MDRTDDDVLDNRETNLEARADEAREAGDIDPVEPARLARPGDVVTSRRRGRPRKEETQCVQTGFRCQLAPEGTSLLIYWNGRLVAHGGTRQETGQVIIREIEFCDDRARFNSPMMVGEVVRAAVAWNVSRRQAARQK